MLLAYIIKTTTGYQCCRTNIKRTVCLIKTSMFIFWITQWKIKRFNNFWYTEFLRNLTCVFEIAHHTLKVSPRCLMKSKMSCSTAAATGHEHEIAFTFYRWKNVHCSNPVNLQNYLIHNTQQWQQKSVIYGVNLLLCISPIPVSANS